MDKPLSIDDAVTYVLDKAKNLNIEADIIAGGSQNFSLKSENNQLSEYKVTSSHSIGIRVIKDEKVATSYSESLFPKMLDEMLSQASESAEYSKIDSYQKLNNQTSHIVTPKEEIYQNDHTTTDEKINLALFLEDEMLSKEYCKSAPYNGYSNSTSNMIYANTYGAWCSHLEKSFSCYTSALLEHNSKQSMFVGVSTGRNFKELDPSFCIDHAYGMAKDLLEGTSIQTGHYSVIFDNSSLNQLFGAFGMCFSGESAMKGVNPWKEKIETTVASDLLSISDISYIKGGNAIKSFDDEGFASTDTKLIENGILNTFLHNSKTSKFFNVKNTFNAARSSKGGLSVGGQHMLIEAGKTTKQDICSGKYLEIVELQGVHSGADAVSGDFSFGASGFLCQDGKRLTPVRGITVAGNFYKMIQSIEAVGNELEFNYEKDFYAPKIRFDQLQIAGAE
ncbi:Zn-dependent protease [Paraphotobacterium marinum]|uniref:Zn-dependent protease n=1 Tax=Paraphotobacterium marinum TaxID=1755811 RepID=A0A220VHE5_9GAMM|nr:metallopeptidase TldD-related protein [Paraphotobacterium marinum]ASK79795.1 Zn-dependent protease [Paraphotobacterium marinum]